MSDLRFKVGDRVRIERALEACDDILADTFIGETGEVVEGRGWGIPWDYTILLGSGGYLDVYDGELEAE